MGAMAKILHRQKRFSIRAFGPGYSTARVIDHIRKELIEVEQAPHDLEEWIDLAMLTFDGAWRSGFTAEEIVAAYVAKLEKNERRKWPDWRTADPTKAIEHVRDGTTFGEFAAKVRDYLDEREGLSKLEDAKGGAA